MSGPRGVLFCEGWDGQRRAVVSPLSAVVARERDRAGQQYSVLLLGDGVPVVLLDVAWRDYVCLVWRFDGAGRREARYDLRRLDDRLMLVEQVQWSYSGPGQAELDPGAGRRTVRYRPDGRMVEIVEPGGTGGGSEHTGGLVSPELLPGMPLYGFGEWAGLASITGVVDVNASLEEVDQLPRGLAVSPDGQPPWRPPRPLQPGDPEELFREGSRVTLAHGKQATVGVREVGQLRVPTGQLVAADLWELAEIAPFAAVVPPGTYPVQVSSGQGDTGGPPMVLAVRLSVAPQPVCSWEPALRPGDDLRVLGEEEFVGFGVDSGTAGLVDAAAAAAAAELSIKNFPLFERIQQDSAIMVDLPDADGNLVGFVSGLGDGYYPTWIGRAADGAVSCFVADMLAVESD